MENAAIPMTLLALGINHQTAPVSLRERVAFSDDKLPWALSTLRSLPSVSEVAVLSTCNRTELYAVTDDEGRVERSEFDGVQRHLS